MTTPPPPRSGGYADDLPPAVTADGEATIRTAAGSSVGGRAFVTNRAPEPRIMAVTFLGVDADWLPEVSRSRVLMPGETVPMDFTLHPAVGTLAAKYPFAITVQAIDPASGKATSSAAIADYALAVDAAGRLEVSIAPAEISRRRRGSVRIVVSNVGSTPESVRLDVSSHDAARVIPSADVVELAPGTSATVPARVKVATQAFGRPTRYGYTVTARGRGAPRRADAAVTTKALFGNTAPKFFALLAVVALWAGLAIVFIPKIVNMANDSDSGSSRDKVASARDKALDKLRTTQTATPSAGASGDGSGSGGSGSGGSGGSGSGGSGSGGSGSGGSGSGGSGSGGSGSGSSGSDSAGAQKVQFSGTVDNDIPAGVTVSMKPTSLVDEDAQGATGRGVNSDLFRGLGKIPEAALADRSSAVTLANPARNLVTKADGSWGFAGVTAPGYYLVTFAKAGFQTQRYVLDASSAAATEPMKVTLVPGKGVLRGVVTGPDGAVGGASLTLSDGTTTVASSSDSSGRNKGDWSVDGLSTPGTYLVTAYKDGLSTDSRIVTLGAGGSGTVNLKLDDDATTLTGSVTGPTSQGDAEPLGNVSVTAASSDTQRTSTTITTGSQTGTYLLPNLPAGRYVITAQAPGYVTQTRAVTIKLNQRTRQQAISMTSATAVVRGTVSGAQFNDDGSVKTDKDKQPITGPVDGAGITLTSQANKYKVTTGEDGAFRLDGVAPGSYVLSAEFAGLGTAYTDVDVKAGIPVNVPDGALSLPVASNKDASSITGFVSSATDPSGALTCQKAVDPTCSVSFTLRNTNGIEVPIATEDSTDPAKYQVTPAPTVPIADNAPTAYSLYAYQGLPAGIYRLTVYVEGYLPGTVTIRVPANTIANAPTVSLFPTNGLTGTVKSVGSNLAKDGPAAPSPDGYVSCIVARPVSDTSPAPTACDFTPPTVDVCKTRGDPQQKVAKLDEDQQYTMTGLCDGTYNIYAVTENPWYVTTTGPAQQTLFRGQTGIFSPEILRDGRVVLQLQTLDSDGNRQTAAGLTGGATCGPTADQSAGDLSTLDGGGNVIIDGVNAAADVTCTVTADGYAPRSIDVGRVSDQQDTSAGPLVLTQPVGIVAGRLVTSYRSQNQTPLGNVRLQLTGVVNDDTTGTTKQQSITVTTDANGCFAVTDTSASSVSACGGTVTDTGTADTPLATNVQLVSAKVAVQSVTSTAAAFRQVDGSYALASSGPAITVQPLPASTSALQITATPAGSNVGGATVTVTPRSGSSYGAGTVTTGSVDNNGNFSWTDSHLGTPGQAWPGTYDVTVTRAGFQSATGVVDCPLQTTTAGCSFTTAPVLTALGGIGGTVTGYLSTSGSTAGNGNPYPTELPAGLSVTASCTSPATDCAGKGTVTATVSSSGQLSFGSTRTFTPGTVWTVSYSASGWKPESQNVTIASGTDADASQAMHLKSVQLTVQLQRNATPPVNYGCTNKSCQVKITRLDTGESQTSDAKASGTFVFTGLSPATYRVEAFGSNFNYTFGDAPLARNTSASTANVTFNLPVNVQVSTASGQVTGLQGSQTTAVGLNGVPVELGTLDGSGNFQVATAEDNTTPMTTTTKTISGQDGRWFIDGVPDGNFYFVRYNGTVSRLDGYRQYRSSDPRRINSGVDNPYGTTQLDRVTRDVTVNLAVNSSIDYSSVAWHLKSASYGQDLLGSGPTTTGNTMSYTFLAVPFGNDWTLRVSLPAGHLGTVTAGDGSSVTQTCSNDSTAQAPARTCTFSTTVTVSGADTTTGVSRNYKLDEYAMATGVTNVPVTTDSSSGQTPQTALTLTIATGGTTVYRSTTVGPNSPGSISLFGATGSSYTVTPSNIDARWSASAVTLTSTAATQNVVLTQRSATVKVTVKDLPTGASGTVTLNLPNSATGTPATQTVSANGDVTFTVVPYYDNVTATFSGTKPGADAGDPPVTVTKTSNQVDIDSTSETLVIDFP